MNWRAGDVIAAAPGDSSACGWLDASYNDSSTLTVSVLQSQADQFTRDSSECNEEVGFKQVPRSVALTTESLSRLYDLEVETAKECPQAAFVFGDEVWNEMYGNG